jgi:diphosphomevalonate decarboxylase
MSERILYALRSLLKDHDKLPSLETAQAFAPSNMALCKYWGKRDEELRLPVNDSLSISLGDHGAFTRITINSSAQDTFIFNENEVVKETSFYKRISSFLNIIRAATSSELCFHIESTSHIPVGTGLASSACGFAALVLAINNLFNWKLTPKDLSIMARLGSGSAARSCEHGFVLWKKGKKEDGSDSYATRFAEIWKNLRVGIFVISELEKKIGSTEAMQRTQRTSIFKAWPHHAKYDLNHIKQAILNHDFERLGTSIERNSHFMHRIIHAAKINYDTPKTLELKNHIVSLRKKGIPIYWTQDAGPNLACLFLEESTDTLVDIFDQKMKIIDPHKMRIL